MRKTLSHNCRHCNLPCLFASGPEEFVNLQFLLVQSSKSFGISSVQFSSQVARLSGKLVQFSSGQWGQVPPFSSFSSVHSDQFTKSSGPDLHIHHASIASFKYTRIQSRFLGYCSGAAFSADLPTEAAFSADLPTEA